MGHQQTLLIVLAVLIIGIAMALALDLFETNRIENEKAYITHDIKNIAEHAQRYKSEGTFTGYSIPAELQEKNDAKYVCISTSTYITITAISKRNPKNQISATLQKNKSVLEDWKYTGDFQ